jgi:hypothetical protein
VDKWIERSSNQQATLLDLVQNFRDLASSIRRSKMAAPVEISAELLLRWRQVQATEKLCSDSDVAELLLNW